MFSLTITNLAIALMVLCVSLVLLAYFYGMKPYRAAYRFSIPEPIEENERTPKASVLVYSKSEDEHLAATLEMLSQQDYPDYEIIVICDGSWEQAEMLREQYSGVYDNVYFTFIQPGSHNLSRSKLTTTIGVKASKGEIIVTTSANIRIPSERWLRRLMRPFCGEQGRHYDVSLGVSRLSMGEMTGPGRWYRQFDELLSNALWVGYAATRNPYRGDGYNLAFRKSVFYDHKGYAGIVFLHSGDDDIFINEISNGSNTMVTVSDEDIIESIWKDSVGNSTNKVWEIRKERYSVTRRWLPRAPFVRSGVMSLLQWAVPATAIAASIISLPNLVPAIISFIILLTFWGLEIYMYRKLAKRFGMIRLWWGVVPFWMWRPIYDLFFRYEHRSARKKNYTWQR